MSLNEVNLIGNVGKAPELKKLTGDHYKTRFSVATSRDFEDRSGKSRTDTQWHEIVCWGKLAERVNEHVSKGHKVFVRGRLVTETYTDSEQIKRRFTYVNAFIVEWMSAPAHGGGQPHNDETAYEPGGSTPT